MIQPKTIQEAVARIGNGVDVLVYSEPEFEKRTGWCSSPVYWAVRKGEVLYECHKEV